MYVRESTLRACARQECFSIRLPSVSALACAQVDKAAGPDSQARAPGPGSRAFRTTGALTQARPLVLRF